MDDETKQEAVGQPLGRLEVERKTKAWLDTYLLFTQDFEPPSIYNLWCGITVLSAAVGRKIWLEEANLKIYPNLYTVLVGPSGIGKGQAMREARPFLDATGIKISPDQATMPKMIEQMAKETTRWVEGVGDVTPYLMWAEELPSFLGMDAYKSGKLADLTSLYDCPPVWEKGTVTRGEHKINSPYVVMLAGSTATGIFDVLPPASVGQGFTSRVMFINANDYKAKRLSVKPWTPKHQERFDALLHDIEVISQMQGPMKMSSTAVVMWTDYNMHRLLPPDEFNDERLQGYAARKPFYVKKLAMLLSLAEKPVDGGPHKMLVREDHIDMAIRLIKGLDKSVRQTYIDIASSNVMSHIPKILKAMVKVGGTIKRVELQRRFSHTMDMKEFQTVMDSLTTMELIDASAQRATNGKFIYTYKLIEGVDYEEWIGRGVRKREAPKSDDD